MTTHAEYCHYHNMQPAAAPVTFWDNKTTADFAGMMPPHFDFEFPANYSDYPAYGDMNYTDYEVLDDDDDFSDDQCYDQMDKEQTQTFLKYESVVSGYGKCIVGTLGLVGKN